MCIPYLKDAAKCVVVVAVDLIRPSVELNALCYFSHAVPMYLSDYRTTTRCRPIKGTCNQHFYHSMVQVCVAQFFHKRGCTMRFIIDEAPPPFGAWGGGTGKDGANMLDLLACPNMKLLTFRSRLFASGLLYALGALAQREVSAHTGKQRE